MLSRKSSVLAMSLLIIPAVAPRAGAQHTPDPYNIVGEYNLGYQDSMYAAYPNGIGFSPNQGVLQGQSRSGVARANQFQSYLDGLEGRSDTSLGRGRGGIEPYYRAHRQYDDVFNRIYSPNEAADKTYYADQEQRTKKYLEYLKESDPKKRAQLYREYNKESLRAARDFGAGSTRAAFRNGTADRSASSGTSVGSGARRPSSLLSPSARSRTSATPPAPAPDDSSETPDQVLERAELMDRTPRTVPPSRVSPRVGPR